MKVAGAAGTPENAWLRQVGGYWSMAASFVLQGALNEELFIQPAVSGEMYFLLAKVQPFLKELREKMGDPHFFGNIEKLVMRSKFGRDRLKFTLNRVETMRREAGPSARPAKKTRLFTHPKGTTAFSEGNLARRFRGPRARRTSCSAIRA